MLYPRVGRSRSVLSLDGLWTFCLDDGTHEERLDEDFIRANGEVVSVPASYNDQKDEIRYREHCGWAYYERSVTIPACYAGQRLFLRFDAVTHSAVVYIDGKAVARHKGGFLPFVVELEGIAEAGDSFTLSVAVDNRVSHSTLPVGNEDGTAFFGSDNAGVPSVEAAKRWRKKRNLPNFDFFNYAGLNRSVRLCSTPKDYIEDITLVPSIDGEDGLVRYSVATVGEGAVGIEILSREGEVVASGEGAEGEIRIAGAHLWNPWPEDPYLYTARVTFASDVYCEPFLSASGLWR